MRAQEVIATHPARPEVALYSNLTQDLIIFDYLQKRVKNKISLKMLKSAPNAGCFLDHDVLVNLPDNFLQMNKSLFASSKEDPTPKNSQNLSSKQEERGNSLLILDRYLV